MTRELFAGRADVALQGIVENKRLCMKYTILRSASGKKRKILTFFQGMNKNDNVLVFVHCFNGFLG